MRTHYGRMTRRKFVGTSVAMATTLHLQQAARALGMAGDPATCRLSAEQEVGPYYVADEIFRSKIAESRPGVPLSLRILLLDARSCKPLSHAAVDLWHCDASGLYSGFTAQEPRGPGGPGGPPPGPPPGFDPDGNHPGPPDGMGPPPVNHPTDKLTFMRGIQLTGGDGIVNFRTIFPGFYMGRTNHIHFKVRVDGDGSGKTYKAGHTSHTGQIFFPEELAARLMEQEPYRSHAIHRTTQAEDQVFQDQHGELSIAKVQPVQGAAGMLAEIVASVDPAATPAPADRRRGPSGQ